MQSSCNISTGLFDIVIYLCFIDILLMKLFKDFIASLGIVLTSVTDSEVTLESTGLLYFCCFWENKVQKITYTSMCAPSPATATFCQWKSREVVLVPPDELHCQINQNISLDEWKDSCVRGLMPTSTILNAFTGGKVMQRSCIHSVQRFINLAVLQPYMLYTTQP